MKKTEITPKANKEYRYFEPNRKQLIIGLIIFLFYIVILKHGILKPIMNLLISDKDLINVCVNPLRNVIILAAYIVLLRRNIVSVLKDFINSKPKENIVWVLKGFLFLLLARIIYALLVVVMRLMMREQFTLLIGEGPQNELMLDTFAMNYPVVMVIFTLILAPILEELVFRYILFHAVKHINKYLAFIIVPVFFSAIHVIDEIISGQYIQATFYLLSYMTIAIPLTILYEKRRNLVFCIILHASVNLMAELL